MPMFYCFLGKILRPICRNKYHMRELCENSRKKEQKNKRDKKQISFENLMFSRLIDGGGWGIRSWFLLNILDKFICNVSQKSSVTVQKQRTVLFFSLRSNPPIFFFCKTKNPPIRVDFLFWRRMGDSNPRAREGKRFSRPPRYDHFDNPPSLTTLLWYHIYCELSRDFLNLCEICFVILQKFKHVALKNFSWLFFQIVLKYICMRKCAF